MATKSMHLDGKSIAQAIDTAVALGATGLVRTVSAAGNFANVDAQNGTVIAAGSASFNMTVPPGLPANGHIRLVNAGTGKVTIVAGAGVTFLNIGAGLIVDSHTTADLYCDSQDTWVVSGGAVS